MELVGWLKPTAGFLRTQWGGLNVSLGLFGLEPPLDLLARSIVKASVRMACLKLAEMEISAALTLI
jgi:hypothetical protein